MSLLSTLSVGSGGLVRDIRGSGPLSERIRELGFVEGEAVFLAQKLWGSGSHIVYVQNTSVALRKEEADCIDIDVNAASPSEGPT